jgi:Leucine rich repeat
MKKIFVVVVFIALTPLFGQDLSWLGKKLDYSDTLRLCDIYKNMKEAMVAPEKVEYLHLVVDKTGENFKTFSENSKSFQNLRKLVLVNSHGLQLKLPVDIWNHTKMEYLLLDGFWGEPLDGLEKLTNLKFLSLNGFALKAFPKQVLSLKKLAVLDLSMNLISQLPAEISQMTALRELELTNNCFTEIPSEISSLNNLEYFTMNNADFGGPIPPGVSNVCLNSFSKFPEVFTSMKKLKRAGIFFHEHIDPTLKKKIKSSYKWIKFS